MIEEKIRCQSCGMPLAKDFGNLGTNRDGTDTSEFCNICYRNGEFTNPHQTLEEMIQSSIANMTSDLQMPLDQAQNLANSFIPTLRRWRS